jgi:hypothetical protein
MNGFIVIGILMILVVPAVGRDRLFDAIVKVESRGNPGAVGDRGKARGLVQSRRPAWREGCKELGVHWNYASGVRNSSKCTQIFHAYTSLYGARTDQQRARIWNGGPSGDHHRSTLPYWHKVRRAMETTKR